VQRDERRERGGRDGLQRGAEIFAARPAQRPEGAEAERRGGEMARSATSRGGHAS